MFISEFILLGECMTGKTFNPRVGSFISSGIDTRISETRDKRLTASVPKDTGNVR